MRGLGVFLVLFGVGSFILPMMGYQFKLMAIFGEARPIVAVIMTVIGAILLGVSFMTGQKGEEGGAPSAPAEKK